MSKPVSFMCRMFMSALLAFLLVFSSFSNTNAEDDFSVTFDAVEDEEFGALSLGCSLEEFMRTGFEPGDSCDVELSNGFRMEDVPVYDGYYVKTGLPLIVLYPGYAHPGFTFSTTGGMWKYTGAKDGDTVTVTLREKGKYLEIQNTMAAVYSNDRNDYGSDEIFSNYRELSGGDLRSGMFFRGASPVDDRNLRAAATDALIRKSGIGFILDLADTEEKAISYPYFKGSRFEELFSAGQAVCLGLKSDYRDGKYAASIADGFRLMKDQDQPVFIHCTEGKDRTGFVGILLEALAGADYEEILRDYMITYDNYYGITETGTPEKYSAVVEIRFRDMLDWLADVPEGTDLSGKTFVQPARDYLSAAGMTETEINSLILFLTGK